MCAPIGLWSLSALSWLAGHRYDALIGRFPEDFRGYLAKGVYLRDKGRRADAERMFLQVGGAGVGDRGGPHMWGLDGRCHLHCSHFAAVLSG
jgi:hypothetical protein